MPRGLGYGTPSSFFVVDKVDQSSPEEVARTQRLHERTWRPRHAVQCCSLQSRYMYAHGVVLK